MSRFEYLGKISIGQYLPFRSILHRLDPRAKLVGYTFLTLALTFSAHIWGLSTALGITLVLFAISRTPLQYMLRGLLPPLPFLMLLAILQAFIAPHAISSQPICSILSLAVFPEGILAAAALLLRFSGLLILLTVATVTISTLEMIDGVDLLLRPLNSLGIPTAPLIMVIQITLRFIPFLAINAEKIAKSQASRGAEWDMKGGGIFRRARRVLPLLIPLFSSSLQQAETLAEAMLARGYAANAHKTSLVSYCLRWSDAIFILFSAIASALILFAPSI